MNGTLARSFALAAAGALAGLLVSGCGGDDTAQSDPTPTPSFSSGSTAPTSSSAPVTPSTSATAETPEAFVRRWNDLLTQMQNRGVTTEFRSISKGCKACRTVADLVDKYYEAGGFVRTRGWELNSVSCKSQATQAECTAKVSNPVTTFQESESSAAKTLPGGRLDQYFRMQLVDGAWTMSYIAKQAT